MAQLKDTVVTGNIRVTNEIQANSVQTSTIKIPTTSGSTTLGPGTAGQVIKSNGTTVYWADDSNTDTNVTQNIKTDNVDRPLLMSNYAKGSTTTSATSVNRAQNIYANPSTGIISVNGVSATGNNLALSGKYGTFYTEQINIGYSNSVPYLYADKSMSVVNISNYNYDTTIIGNSLKLQCMKNSNVVDYLDYNEAYDEDSQEYTYTLGLGAQDFDVLVNGQKFDVEASFARIMDGNGQLFKIENGEVYCHGSTVNITSGTSTASPGTINIGNSYTTTISLRGGSLVTDQTDPIELLVPTKFRMRPTTYSDDLISYSSTDYLLTIGNSGNDSIDIVSYDEIQMKISKSAVSSDTNTFVSIGRDSATFGCSTEDTYVEGSDIYIGNTGTSSISLLGGTSSNTLNIYIPYKFQIRPNSTAANLISYATSNTLQLGNTSNDAVEILCFNSFKLKTSTSDVSSTARTIMSVTRNSLSIGNRYSETSIKGSTGYIYYYDEDGAPYEVFSFQPDSNNKLETYLGHEADKIIIGNSTVDSISIQAKTMTMSQKCSASTAILQFGLPTDFAGGTSHTLLAIDGVHVGSGMTLGQAGDSDITIGIGWIVLTGSIAAGSSYTIITNLSGVTVADLSKYLIYVQPMYGGSSSTMHCLYGRLTTPDNTNVQLYVHRENGASTSAVVQFKAFLLKYTS